jgi:bifunctional non-homologous end joining protein LigD
MPFTVPQPMLASLADKLPVGPQWSYEIKWDGYRCPAEKRGSRVILHSRRAMHGTNYPSVTAAVHCAFDVLRFGDRDLRRELREARRGTAYS